MSGLPESIWAHCVSKIWTTVDRKVFLLTAAAQTNTVLVRILLICRYISSKLVSDRQFVCAAPVQNKLYRTCFRKCKTRKTNTHRFKTKLTATLKQLNGTFHFLLILVVPVVKGGSVSPNVRLHVPSASLPAARRLLPQEESGWQPRRPTFS